MSVNLNRNIKKNIDFSKSYLRYTCTNSTGS